MPSMYFNRSYLLYLLFFNCAQQTQALTLKKQDRVDCMWLVLKNTLWLLAILSQLWIFAMAISKWFVKFDHCQIWSETEIFPHPNGV